MPAAKTPKYHISAMTDPGDWNETGLYETFSVELPDHDNPVEWRGHHSTEGIAPEMVADKLTNFLTYKQKYEARNGPKPDIWAAYDLPGKPPRKLIIHQCLGDRLPTAYTVPADKPYPLTLQEEHRPIARRA